MKNYITISLFIFWAVVVAILTAGLVFYNNNNTPLPITANSGTNSTTTNTIASTPVGSNTISGSKANKTSAPRVTSPANINTAQTPVITPAPAPTNNSVVLSAAEVAKHNTASDCWMILSGKVYNFTSFIPSHPGGSSMVPYCGRDGTSSFVSGPPHRHSSFADSLLPNYYIGDLNQAVSANQTPLLSPPNTSPALPANLQNGDNEGNDD